MSSLSQRMQELSRKAAQLKQAAESAPAKVAELRKTVSTTVGEFRQLRSDVQSAVTTLQTDDETRFVQSLKELDENSEILREAGYVVDEAEIEIGLSSRLVVHLEKVDDAPHPTIRSLIQSKQHLPTVHAILTALLKAEEMSDHVHLNTMTYHRLTVYVGMTSCVRLCWSAGGREVVILSTASTPPKLVTAPPQLPSAQSSFTSTSFFERRSPAPPTPAVLQPVVATLAPVPQQQAVAPDTKSVSSQPPAATGDWRQDALARFKKMPDLSKR
ncbi:MAG TPA: hypothetical protein VK968_05710 [Roseimicrobium sp.]|nr:hypothetical protein [Roseimicrobium sp.]